MSAVSGRGLKIPGTAADRQRSIRQNLVEFRGFLWDAVTDYIFGIAQVDIDWRSPSDLTGIQEWIFSADGDMDTQPSVDVTNNRLEISATGTTNQYQSNLREAQTFPETSGWGVSHVKTTFWGPDVFNSAPAPGPVRNQHGVVLRAQEDVIRRAIIVWHDIVFSAPYVINVGVWKGTLTGDFFTNRQGSATMNGLREVWNWTSASRTSMVVTFSGVTPDPTSRLVIGDKLRVTDNTSAGYTDFDGDIVVTGMTSNTITGTQLWPLGSADLSNANTGMLERFFPYTIEVIVEGTYVSVRAAHLGDALPAWNAVDDRVYKYDLESDTAAAKATLPTPRGTGRIGFVSSHIGYDPIIKARYGDFYGDSAKTTVLINAFQALESEIALPIARPKVVTVGQALETESGLRVNPLVRTSAEQEIAQALTVRKARSALQASEQELAQTVAEAKSRTPAQASETELSQSVSRTKIKTALQSIEPESAQFVRPSRAYVAGQATEAELAREITFANFLRQVAETELAQSFVAQKLRAVSQTSESELGQQVARIKLQTATQAIETEVSTLTVRSKLQTVVQVSEAESGQAIGRAKARTVVQATEQELGQDFSPGIRLVLETETAGAVTVRKVKASAQATEEELSQTVRAGRSYAAAQASETELSQAIANKTKLKQLPQALENEIAGVINVRGVVTPAPELETAGAIAARKLKPILQASETESATTTRRLKLLTVQQIAEQEIARTFKPQPFFHVVAETELAQAFTTVKRKELRQTAEVEIASGVVAGKGATIGVAAEMELGLAFSKMKLRLLLAALEEEPGMSIVRFIPDETVPSNVRGKVMVGQRTGSPYGARQRTGSGKVKVL